MTTIRNSVEVDVPVSAAYERWTHYEDFPRFMDGVEEVKKLDSSHLHWRARIAGKREEWDAEITEDVPHKRIAWRSTSGRKNDGAVEFEPLSPTSTRIHLQLEWEPHGAMEKLSDMIGLEERKLKKDLKQFKDYVEHQSTPH